MAAAPELTLLDVLPEMTDVVDPAVVGHLRRFFARSTITLDAGPWDDAAIPPQRGAFGLVVLDGLLVRECVIEDRRGAEVLTPGDVVAPWIEGSSTLPVDVHWHVAQPAQAAVLDRAFLAASSRWPGLTACIAARYGETCARLATHKAICQLPRVEDRVALVLWHLSERMGHVARDGTTVPLGMTHAQLGHLVGAQRSTVTLALKDLARRGEVVRRDDGTFVLKGEPPVPDYHDRARRRRAAPMVARAAVGDLPDFAALRARVAALGAQYGEASRHVSDELERARVLRERSAALRERARERRLAQGA
jgi:CRP/FNR family cyclic AMP-dependent transcriptional regulator